MIIDKQIKQPSKKINVLTEHFKSKKPQKLKTIKAKISALDEVYKDLGKITLLFGSSKYYQKFTAQHLIVHAFLPLKLGQYKML